MRNLVVLLRFTMLVFWGGDFRVFCGVGVVNSDV